MNLRVYVDAKIEGRHVKESPKNAFVAYVVEGDPNLRGFAPVDATETDEAELQAVAFAIRELKDRFDRFTIICDHESVVSEMNRKESKLVKRRPILKKILEARALNPLICFESLPPNPAHKFLNQRLKELKEREMRIQAEYLEKSYSSEEERDHDSFESL